MRPIRATLAWLRGAALLGAPLAAQAGPIPHDLGATIARSPAFRDVPQLLVMHDGRLLVAGAFSAQGEQGKRGLFVFDSSLNRGEPVHSGAATSDTVSGAGQLMRLRGDSLLMFDAAASVFVVIDPGGQMGRVFAAPPSAPPLPSGTISRSAGAPFSYARNLPTASPTLGLIYRVDLPFPPLAPRVASGVIVLPVAGQPDVPFRTEDSVAWLRMQFDSRAIDTLTWAERGTTSTRMLGPGGSLGGSTAFQQPALYPFYDDAVTTSDGSVVILHAREYRLEWIGPSGVREAAPRLTYPWRSITDLDRAHVLDSVNSRRRQGYDNTLAKRATDSAAGRLPYTTATRFTVDTPDGEVVRIPVPPPSPPLLATPADVPDFYPPTTRGALLADGDGHIWIRPATGVKGGPEIWDVVDRERGVIDRVSIPGGDIVVGFGAGGFVFVVMRDAGSTFMEKRRVVP